MSERGRRGTQRCVARFLFMSFLQELKGQVHVGHHATRQKQAILVPPPYKLTSVTKFFMGVNSAEETDVLIREKCVNPA